MARRSKYPPEFIQHFIAMVIENGGNIEGTAKQLGIPPTTAKRMVAKNPIETSIVLDTKRNEMVEKAHGVAMKIYRQLSRRLTKIAPERLRAYDSLLKTCTETVTKLSVMGPGAKKKTKRTVSEKTTGLLKNFEQGDGVTVQQPSGEVTERTVTITEEDE